MGLRGPKPKLAAIERLEGTPGKRPIIESGIEGLGEAFVPDHLPDDAQACIEVVKGSMPAKIYSALDSYTLAAFAMAWAIHKRAAHEISNPDFSWIVLNTSGNEAPNGWLKIINQQASLIASLGDRLGLNPKARAALHLPAEKPRSKFDGLTVPTVSSNLSKH
jgi:phage terminase small subunit